MLSAVRSLSSFSKAQVLDHTQTSGICGSERHRGVGRRWSPVQSGPCHACLPAASYGPLTAKARKYRRALHAGDHRVLAGGGDVQPAGNPTARPAQRVFDVAPGEPLPWNPGHPVQATRLTKDQAWRHTVYVGLYPREAVFSALKDVFPPATRQLRGASLGAERPAGFCGFGERHPAREAPRCSRPAPGRRRVPSIRDRRPPHGSTASPTSNVALPRAWRKRFSAGPRSNASRCPRLGHPQRMPRGSDRGFGRGGRAAHLRGPGQQRNRRAAERRHGRARLSQQLHRRRPGPRRRRCGRG